jgi:hypothetical protein
MIFSGLEGNQLQLEQGEEDGTIHSKTYLSLVVFLCV